MKKYYQSIRTKSLYGVVYETPSAPALPTNGVEWIILECLKKYPTDEDQELVTIPKSLLSKYFLVDIGRDNDKEV